MINLVILVIDARILTRYLLFVVFLDNFLPYPEILAKMSSARRKDETFSGMQS